jgi:hypothetical protein
MKTLFLTPALACVLTLSVCAQGNGAKPAPQSIRKFDFETKPVLLNSGYTMPILGMGTYSLSDEVCFNSVTALLNSGGRLIDTAFMYHNEASVGRAVRASSVPSYRGGIPSADGNIRRRF